MQSSQIDLLLNQLLECSFNIYNAIKNNDTLELDALINIKNEKLQLIESNKKFGKSIYIQLQMLQVNFYS